MGPDYLSEIAGGRVGNHDALIRKLPGQHEIGRSGMRKTSVVSILPGRTLGLIHVGQFFVQPVFFKRSMVGRGGKPQ